MYATLTEPLLLAPECPTLLTERRWASAAQIAGAQGNLLLEALPAADWEHWSDALQLVEMPRGQVLYESGCNMSHVHFPTSSIVSLLHQTASGACAEVATVGNDGVVGVPLLMGGLSTNGRAVVQSAGLGYRLPREVVVDAFNAGGEAMQLLLRYTQALLTQVSQTALCNRHHAVEQQVCRLILLNLDRVQGNCLQMTQELLAGKLGVRRESVTLVALALQRDGLIRYARGRIEVLDRAGLEDRACECYAAVKQECDRLLPPRAAADDTPHRAQRPSCGHSA
ncbi:MAG: Crp/Fnr family transcriptional regulator [Hydrogenophaga sp.]|jgi:CRP-like cAMP-binding protein|uniref:Crp/Fnr family transcriptional regulator n=1 Tax=Hydrogenophaga sp. TaxID=1904254 RepID=UPI0025C61A57|nr:Crp/Fnr family transcriptional regulator [Hydrogenophaga sp.]MDO8888202.1 Crp/Fnr family transcriptional regulator [Hydrogenophaga sp.]MDO9132597.1 Crp/Fnr family transcriptional regulator [Hydrogenophaga sp.]MDO9506621.1 Crp/Fnr family transcriptional regulator [Hydrogenophaga sp.]MDP1782754.1 Crp/Fnr family transcriptional regulator [Hydrogenophaga sp.]MDP2249546.1 Crp/Fnr family transcriptional regulator [Hydrogenophaga sp.]